MKAKLKRKMIVSILQTKLIIVENNNLLLRDSNKYVLVSCQIWKLMKI